MKCGFTLAEVLVTLGIIGVVAALTTPALIQNVGNSKVGPKLQKAKSTFENAVQMMLTENNANTIMSVASDNDEFGTVLSNYMKISPNNEKIRYKYYNAANVEYSTPSSYLCSRYDSDDGMSYYICLEGGILRYVRPEYPNIPNNQLVGNVFVDINGGEKPNSLAKDLFLFALYNDGTLRPWGGKNHYRSQAVRGGLINSDRYWYENGNCDDKSVNDPSTCAGSIFENGMKIIYQ